MDVGIYIFPTDKTIRPDELARAVEDHGFDSLWFPEHSHIPVSRRTPWGGVKGAPPLPEQYWRTFDQFVALMAAAAATSTLKIGSGITLAAQRDPIWLAKEVASVDVLSNGRLLFGIGYGWNKEEMANHGLAYLERRAILRENILAMKELWAEDEAEFSGEHVTFEASWAWPKPEQKPHPPILLGGAAGPKTMADIVEFCDGWMPNAARHDILDKIATLRELAADAGRDPDTLDITAWAPPKDPDVIAALADAGVNRVVYSLPAVERDAVLGKLAERAALKDAILA